MSEWQPIATAPKDGRVILVRYNGGNWSYGPDQQNIVVKSVVWRNGCWREWGPGSYDDCHLSHWHPVPEPPK